MMVKTQTNEPEIPFYERLCERCGDDAQPVKTAVVHPLSDNALRGAVEAAAHGLIEPVLVGPAARIRQLAEETALDIQPYRLEDTEHSHEAAQKAVALAREGKVDALMKGHLHTDELLGFVTSSSSGLRTERRMSHVFCIDIPEKTYPKPLWLSDAALNIEPDFDCKRDIIQNAIDLFRACGFGTPNVAVLSATEKITDAIPSTLEAAALSKLAERGKITGGRVDGPLAFDNAISKEAAKTKNIRSDVAGDADILIVPDLESGNMLYKQMKYLSGYNAAGLVVGARVPIMLTSRAGGVRARLASAALALLYVNSKEAQLL